MIRFILSLCIFFGLDLASSAQVFICEDFSARLMPPQGWSVENYPTHWSISNAYYAGGIDYPEGRFNYVEQPIPGITTSRLISPMIDLTGFDSVKIYFCYAFGYYGSPPPLLGLATRSAGGNWNTVWSITPTASFHLKQINRWLTNSDVGSDQFQFCLFLAGDLYNMSYWSFDDITLSKPFVRDGFLKSLGQTPDHVTGPLSIDGEVMNTGSDSIHSAVINWTLDNGPVHSTSITGLRIRPSSAFTFTCTDSVYPPAGKSHLLVWIETINDAPDEYLDNDTLSMIIQNVTTLIQRKPLFEEFTSSTCIYCPGFDAQFIPWCDSIGDNITVVKYQMDWPGQGDLYYTVEGGIRSDFYFVDGVPDIRCDGGDGLGNVDLKYVRRAYNSDIQEKAMMSVRATHALTGHVVSLSATVVPYADFSRLKLFAAVVEKVTYNNAGSNGQTEFRDVMMKMLPDAYGVQMNLVCGQPFLFSTSADLDTTNIERWDDLKVVVWVEDTVERVVNQSCYSVESAVLGTEARLSNILVDSTGIAGFDPDIFHYWVTVSGYGSITYPVQGIPIDTNETVIVTPALGVPGTATIDVYAQDNQTHNRYFVNFSTVGISGNQGKNTTVCPNPVTGRVFIYGADHARVSLLTGSGVSLREQNDFTGPAFSLEGISMGVYLLEIIRKDGSATHKKIVIK
jgi:hypothetical protein